MSVVNINDHMAYTHSCGSVHFNLLRSGRIECAGCGELLEHAVNYNTRNFRFNKTYCSQCGGEFGPGDEGYSHCEDHAGARLLSRLMTCIEDYGQAREDELPLSSESYLKAARVIADQMQPDAYAEGRKDEAEERAWRPIETAPIDERILIAATPDWVIEGLVLPDADTAMGEPVTRRIYCHADGCTLHPNLVPTHWMPLPKHPEAA